MYRAVFLLQTDDQNMPMVAEAVAVLERIRFENWRGNNVYKAVSCSLRDAASIVARESGEAKLIVPVGTVEFSRRVLAEITGRTDCLRAINIPDELYDLQYTQRNLLRNVPGYLLTETAEKFHGDSIFVKPAGLCKEFESEILRKDQLEEFSKLHKKDTLLVSELLSDIISEWRVLVSRGEVVDIRPSLLDKLLMPHRPDIWKMVEVYEYCPMAYTLDVAVFEDWSSAVLEVHNFIACGLYGFEGKQLLPMLEAGVKWEIEQAKCRG